MSAAKVAAIRAALDELVEAAKRQARASRMLGAAGVDSHLCWLVRGDRARLARSIGRLRDEQALEDQRMERDVRAGYEPHLVPPSERPLPQAAHPV